MRSAALLWRAFEANEVTHSGAHYLLALAALSREGTAPRAVDIARSLAVSRSAVSLQLRTLEGQHLVRVADDQRLHLTRAGADLVARIAGKREIVHAFLRDVLGVSEKRAQMDACKVEHLLSEETGAALVHLIRFLKSDHPVVKSFLRTYRRTVHECPPGELCEFCPGSCLLRTLGRD